MKRSREAADAGGSGSNLESLLAASRPAVVVFDLDSTLWMGNVESFGGARVVSEHEAVDMASGKTLRLFPDVRRVFSSLEAARVPIAIASASPAAAAATRLLKAWGLSVAHAEIYPGAKDAHLRAISAKLKVPLSRALFFDDLPHNIRAADKVGVGAAVLVRNGLRVADVVEALDRARHRSRGASLMQSWMAGGRSPRGGGGGSGHGSGGAGGDGGDGGGGGSDGACGAEQADRQQDGSALSSRPSSSEEV